MQSADVDEVVDDENGMDDEDGPPHVSSRRSAPIEIYVLPNRDLAPPGSRPCGRGEAKEAVEDTKRWKAMEKEKRVDGGAVHVLWNGKHAVG